MIKFYKTEDKIIFSYSADDYGNPNWVSQSLDEHGEVTFKRTFDFRREDLFGEISVPDEDAFGGEGEHADFIFAERVGDYYRVKKKVLTSDIDVFLAEDIDLSLDMFVSYNKISIFNAVEALISEDIYIGGENVPSIPVSAFLSLVRSFPNSYEREKYSRARITSILRNYFDSAKNAEKEYESYLNKKQSRVGSDLIDSFKEVELLKFRVILKKLEEMLAKEEGYNERQWQNEIIQIIRLLYPKYICVFKEVPINDKAIKERFLDLLLVDSSGHPDIVEIKKPFNRPILSDSRYRDNYIPLRELSGTIMQVEKYIYYLNRWGVDGEKKLTEKYKDQLPDGLGIKITNPSGIVIMGRDNNLNSEQKSDFEIVKRKYKNMIDIITYDDLIRRLKFTIEQFEKK